MSTAESLPIVRRAAKGVGLFCFGACVLAALFMTASIMISRASGEEWFVAFGLITLGLGADLFVAAGPVIMRSAWSWGAKAWTAVGWGAFALALAFSFSNKLAYWSERYANKEDRQAILAQVDPLAAERRLVKRYPDVRQPEAVQAELEAQAAAVRILEQRLLALPQNRITQRDALLAELQAARAAAGALTSELETARAVAAASARLDAGAERAANRTAQAQRSADPFVLWLQGLSPGLTAAAASVLMHAFFALFHEAFQMVGLGLATLRPTPEQRRKEQEAELEKARLRVEATVEKTRLEVERATKVQKARALKSAMLASAPELARIEADLATQAKRRELAAATARADLEAQRLMREIEKEHKAFLQEVEFEESRANQPEEPLLQLPGPDADLAEPKERGRPRRPRTKMFDALTGERIIQVPGHERRIRNRRKMAGSTVAELDVPADFSQPQVVSPSDGRVAPRPEEPPAEAPLPVATIVLGRGFYGVLPEHQEHAEAVAEKGDEEALGRFLTELGYFVRVEEPEEA